ncbi:MAG: hypothetical protein JO306_14935 [Gemmatimonadetes bacterium]|nr:hypothetical protein [Gemmatimonadota bacterium]
MEFNDLIKLLVICSVIVLPMLALTARFALKPIVDALLRLKVGGVLPGEGSAAEEMRLLRGELRQMHDELAQMRTTVDRLQEAESFDRALAGTRHEAAALPAPR